MRPFVIIALSLLASLATAKVKIVTTTTDLKALVEVVGGDKVEVSSIAKGTQDPHQIEAKPSFIVQLRQADLVVAQGLDLESAWITPLVQGARNPRIQKSTKGFLELGPLLNPLDVQEGPVTRSQGDVHPEGNPHFQLDPIRMGKAAVLLANHLALLDQTHKEFYKTRALEYEKRMSVKTTEWEIRLAKTSVKEVVTYHKTLIYFLDRFGIQRSLQLEPKPGIPPTASHLLDVIAQMKARKISLVMIENYFRDEVSKKLKQEVPGVQVKKVPVSVGGEPSITSTEDLIENLVKTIEGIR